MSSRRHLPSLVPTQAMSFAEVMKQVQTMDYSCIVFDTAPTGHTLRLLQFPTTLQKGMDKLLSLKGSLGGLLSQVGGDSLLQGGLTASQPSPRCADECLGMGGGAPSPCLCSGSVWRAAAHAVVLLQLGWSGALRVSFL